MNLLRNDTNEGGGALSRRLASNIGRKADPYCPPTSPSKNSQAAIVRDMKRIMSSIKKSR